MPADYAAKAAAMLIAMNAIAIPLPEVIADTNTVTFVDVLAEPDGANDGRLDFTDPNFNIGCRQN